MQVNHGLLECRASRSHGTALPTRQALLDPVLVLMQRPHHTVAPTWREGMTGMPLAIMVGDICPGWGIPGRDRPPMLNAMLGRGIPCMPCIAHSTFTAVPNTRWQA